ncbi:RNA polymerase sigma factor [Paenibacillus sp. MMS18-CY102]|uniref:RNA polymerase sigma factor n=1 Tax=Paenibacillus sp. MMS18-CY102 TaxID=2682849 RepID=UPI0013662978|nr:RNA polymerase sigma factor [Paenibacillus sp. MMS18-CY102]MWC27748.1 sigma-70 family RNA polymerase sigma factor [Paenibacillus sp. MMS18-CY102]
MEPLNRKEQERQVINEVLQGNRDAYAYLVDLYKDKLYGLLRRMGASPEDAKDIAQESFIRAYRKLATHRLDGSFASWLYTIAVRICYGHQKKIPAVSCSEQTDRAPSRLAEPENEAIYRENKQELLQSIDKLSPQQKLVVLLRYTNDLTYDEIEAITGFNQNQIKNGLYRAKQKLRALLVRKGGDPNEMLEPYTDRGSRT